MVIEMKMPISGMVYILNKLIEDKKQFTISSSAMDLRFMFTYTGYDKWFVEISLGAIDYVGRLSFSYCDKLDADIFRVFDFGGDEDGYDAIGFTLDYTDHAENFQSILIRDKNPDLNF